MNELRQTKIEMLKYAKRAIQQGRVDLICVAITSAFHSKVVKSSYSLKIRAENDLHRYIRKALCGELFYSSWAHAKFKDKYYKVPYEKRMKMLKQGRINWINWMIQCLEEDEAKENVK